MKKRILSLALAALLMATGTTNVMAAEVSVSGGQGSSQVELTVNASNFSVTVPTILPITVDTHGVVTTAMDAKIINNSQSPVKVTDINIVGSGGWSVVDFNTDMSKEKVGEKKLGFKINNILTQANGNFIINSTNFPAIDGKNDTSTDELPLMYDAKVPAQKIAIVAGTKVADVIFTIGWDE